MSLWNTCTTNKTANWVHIMKLESSYMNLLEHVWSLETKPHYFIKMVKIKTLQKQTNNITWLLWKISVWDNTMHLETGGRFWNVLHSMPDKTICNCLTTDISIIWTHLLSVLLPAAVSFWWLLMSHLSICGVRRTIKARLNEKTEKSEIILYSMAYRLQLEITAYVCLKIRVNLSQGHKCTATHDLQITWIPFYDNG